MPEAVRGRTGNGGGEGVEEGVVMGENKQVESEKQKVPENQEKKDQENTAYKKSKEQEGDIDKDKGGFFSLCPSILENNEEYKSYYEALDYAFDNDDIKNIAITGIYGAGKSTVWQSYVKKKELKNIVTITLGQYESSVDRETVKGSDRINYNQELEQENRIERKLINQIISQISIKDTPLSKYKIKINKAKNEICLETICIVCFLLSILFWLEKEWIFEGLREPFKYILLKIFSILKFESKAEFILQCLKHSSQLLYFIFCLLLFIIPVFYFLLRFVGENRFFIHKIQLKGVETIINDGNIDEESVLDKDIKEIIYLLTSAKVEILVIEDLDRFNNITIFTKLRELNYMLNKHLEANYPERKVKFVYMLRDGILEAKDRVKFFDFVLPILPYIYSRNSESLLLKGLEPFGFDSNNRLVIAISLYIDEMRLLKNIINEYQVYEKMLNINKASSKKDKLLSFLVVKNLFPHQFELLLMNQGYLYDLFNKKEEYIKFQKSKSVFIDYPDISHIDQFLATLNSIDQVDDYFKFVAEDSKILKNHYFPLIKILVTEGYFAEDYYFYISPFHEGGLSKKDRIFMRQLFERYDNIFTEIDNPESIYRRLSKEDFKKSNVLNATLLRDSLKRYDLMDVNYPYPMDDGESKKRVEMLIESVCTHNHYIEILIILSSFDYEYIRPYVEIATQSNLQHIETILEIVSGKRTIHEDQRLVDIYFDQYGFDAERHYREIQNSILRAMMLFSQQQIHIFLDEIKCLREILVNNSSVLLELENNEVNTFFENLTNEKIFFNDLEFWQNLNDMVCDILSKEIFFEELLSSVYQCTELRQIYKYIKANFEEFIEMYIRDLQEDEVRNIESVVVDILNSNISEEDKIIYIEKNIVKIKDINKLKIALDGNIARKLYLKNNISCSKENIIRCYEAIILSDVPEFVDYLNRNINTQNEEEILKDNPKLCEDLLKSEKTSEELCLLLIENKRIEISEYNVHRLVDLSYTKSIYKWLELVQEKGQDDLVEFLCTANLDKIRDRLEIFLRHLKEDNAKKLIDKVTGEMKIYRIAPNRTEIKKYLLLKFPITAENIRYICKYFKRFKYKQEFLDSLTRHNQFQDLTDEDLNKEVMNYLLSSTLVSTKDKVKLLQTKIQNEVEHSELKEYIDFVDEVKDLNEVWNHKQLKLDNTYKQDIGKALADNGYVNIRNDSPNPYIVLVD